MSEFIKSSFLDDFDVPVISHDTIKKQLVKLGKTHNVKKRNSIESMPLQDRLDYVYKNVIEVLGRYKGFVRTIRSKEELFEYIDKAIDFAFLSFDTETNNSLDPLTCKLMGLCCYIPNTKPVYIPINHTIPGTDTLLENQVSMEDVCEALQKLKSSSIKMIYHNGKFDIRVCYNTTGVRLPIWWDTMIGAQLLNENELARLKHQHKVHVDPTVDTYNIEKLFTGLPYAWIDPEIFALYAAIDSYDTYNLQQYQQKEFEKADMSKLYSLFLNVEVPIVLVTSKMEDDGICMDLDFVKKLHEKYTNGLNDSIQTLENILLEHKPTIEYYQALGKLDKPINYESNQQLSIILYDILKAPAGADGKKSTDKAALKALKIPFTEALLSYRHFSILIKTFTAPLPEWLSSKDGKLHANFNQLGKEDNNVRTGRFSSTQPNLQQIPSKEKVMRMMFKASPGHTIVGGDFSAQEPRILAQISQDQKLLENFEQGRDVYATVYSTVTGLDYWDCMEHYEDGTPNPTGKATRGKGKSLILGIMYGMGAKLMSSMLGVSMEECFNILKDFFNTFPAIKEFTASNERAAKEIGYVEDYLGRRRHLPDASLSEIEVRAKKEVITDCNLFIDCTTDDCKISIPDDEANIKWTNLYNERYANRGYEAKTEFKKLAAKSNIDIFDNGAFISKTLTQCTNARIQGSAASLTKKAMVAIYNNKELNELGFKLLIPVHDELLGECPTENVDKVEKLLAQCMVDAAKPECSVKMAVDTYTVKHWYADEVRNAIHEKYREALSNGFNSNDIIDDLANTYCELNYNVVRDMCLDTYDVVTGGV